MNTMEQSKKMAPLALFGVFLLFLGVGLVMLVWPIISMLDTMEEINTQAEFITFDKGAFYLFGGGAFFVVMTVGSAISFYIKDRYARKYTTIIIVLIVMSLSLIFILPHLVHAIVEDTVAEKGYVVCEARSTQWLHARVIVYTKKLPCD